MKTLPHPRIKIASSLMSLAQHIHGTIHSTRLDLPLCRYSSSIFQAVMTFIGGIIMSRGDDAGLMLPPKVAPVQVVIVPIWRKDDEKTAVLKATSSVKETLQAAGIRVKLDDSDQRTPGWKFNFWEMKGVPLRIEIGPRDVSSGKQGKVFGVSMEPPILEAFVKDNLDAIQSSLLERAIAFRDRFTPFLLLLPSDPVYLVCFALCEITASLYSY
ncbi:putative proline--tRNA ligase [Lupinus albus]|uniref:Putative proline--tRNA ligase n=1 Tax=Lupinus albus TaxID=3870 RepID=A0A6A4QXE0_LUPAL|nr:putative proline--tRNA ligase [Lupinus albus]